MPIQSNLSSGYSISFWSPWSHTSHLLTTWTHMHTPTYMHTSTCNFDGVLMGSIKVSILWMLPEWLQLRATMTSLSPIASRPLPSISTYLPTALGSCTHVFIRRDSVKKPLQSPYDGPFRVIRRTPKYYQLEMYGRHDTVSVDRLKPAHVDVTISRSQPAVGAPHSPPGHQSPSTSISLPTSSPVAPVPTTSSSPPSLPASSPSAPSSPPTSPSSATTPPVFTRSGRWVHFPQHLMNWALSLAGE